jgi:histidinol-phosphatase (PHP family)
MITTVGNVIQPADGHVHTEFSWDAPDGSMERTCARAVQLGLPAVAFTEHVDYSRWTVDEVVLQQSPLRRELTGPDSVLVPPELDQERYLAPVERCRELFPSLRVISGVELGEPHWNAVPVAKLLGTGHYERVLGSLHALPVDGRLVEANALYRQRPAVEVLQLYLAEIADLIARTDAFAVLAHLDYAVRGWPAEAGPFDLHAFEDEFRHALHTLAATDRVATKAARWSPSAATPTSRTPSAPAWPRPSTWSRHTVSGPAVTRTTGGPSPGDRHPHRADFVVPPRARIPTDPVGPHVPPALQQAIPRRLLPWPSRRGYGSDGRRGMLPRPADEPRATIS